MSESLLTRREVEARVGFRKTVIYERMAAGTFPRAIRDPATGSVRWLESEINAWINDAINQWVRVGTVMGRESQAKQKPLESAA